MKKSDIKKLVKESIKELKEQAYGSATLTTQGQSISGAPGVWEQEKDEILNSAEGVILPSDKAAPPIKTISLIFLVMVKSFCKANAILVNGPVGHKYIESDCE